MPSRSEASEASPVAAVEEAGGEAEGDAADGTPERVAKERVPSTRAGVMLRAAQTVAELGRLRERMDRLEPIATVQKAVVEHHAAVEQLAAISEATAQAALYIEQTDDIEYVWARQAETLAPARNRVEADAAEYHTVHARADELAELWEKTRAAFAADETEAESLLQHIDETHAAVAELKEEVTTRELDVLRASIRDRDDRRDD